jgi:hypothetical protein
MNTFPVAATHGNGGFVVPVVVVVGGVGGVGGVPAVGAGVGEVPGVGDVVIGVVPVVVPGVGTPHTTMG